jgi:cell division protein FtsQ
MGVTMAQKKTREKQLVKISRSKAKRQRMQTIRRWLLATASLCILASLITIGLWIQHNQIVSKASQALASTSMNATRQAGLRVRNIYIDGREKTSQAAILSALGVQLGGSLLALNPAQAKERLEEISTIRQASIERILPDTIHVTLEERTPVAIWQNKQVLHLIDKDGIVLEGEDAKKYKHLMLFVGEGAPIRATELMHMLSSQPELEKQVTAAIRIGDRRWNLRLKNGVNLLLPEEDTEKAWEKLAELEKNQSVLEKPIVAIDMRLPERIFIRLTPENVARRIPKARGPRTET